MGYQIEKCKAEDYDELLVALNRAFGKEGERSFEITLPVMWERDDEHMSKHIAIRVDGKIAGAVGIYPLPTVIAGEPVKFCTVGNIGVLPEYSGQGMMKALMTEALAEAKRIGVDVVRLGGLRQRYNRYGFENGGVDYQWILTPKNISDYYSIQLKNGGRGFERYMTFRRISPEDAELMQFVINLHNTADMYVDRGGAKQFFKTMSAYKNEIHAAFDRDGKPVGYICASSSGLILSEHKANTVSEEYQMICEWLLHSEVESLTIHTAPWESELNRLMGKICEKWSLYDSHHFNPYNWSKLLNALLKIKSKYSVIPAGSLIIKIEGYGTVELIGNNCVDTDKEPQLTLGHLDAVRLLLGSLPVSSVADLSGLPDDSRLYAECVLPLPLWWCNQDRV